MSTPTLKELIEKATPGPWWLDRDDAGRPPMHSDYRVLSSGSTPKHVAPIARMELRGQESEANAQLIARCNPATMAKVVEALLASRHQLETPTEREFRSKAVHEALNLLNGKPNQ